MRIACYCRVSTDTDEQLSSLSNQRDFFVEYARRNGYDLFRLYADEGISGTSLKKRQEFKRLLQDAELGLFDMVVVKDVSRFARNTVDALQSIRKLKSMGINTLFLTANMDSMGDSEFVLTLFSAMAQEESNNLSKRVKWGKKINAEKGRVPQKVFGYDRVDNFTLKMNEDEARIVRKIFNLYTDHGLGCRTISMTLNQDEDKTKHGNDWNARGVRRVLVNPLYCGILINHKYEIEDFLTGKQVAIPKEEHFSHERPEWAIISKEMFQKAQAVMESRRIKYDSGKPFKEGRYSSKHIFSTLIKCEHCGRSFTRKSYTYANTRVYWRCVTNDQYTAEKCDNRMVIDEPDLLAALKTYFASLIKDREGFTGEVLTALDRQLPPIQNPAHVTQELESERKKLVAKRSRYQDMYVNELLTMDELKEKLEGITHRIGQVDAALAKTLQSAKQLGDAQKRVEICMQEIMGFLNFETVTNMDIRRIIDHISVNKNGNVRIVFRRLHDIKIS